MHFTCQKMHSAVRTSLAGILLTQTRSQLANASCELNFTPLKSEDPADLHDLRFKEPVDNTSVILRSCV